MPAFKLEFEVDGAAHPELYAALSGIENPLYLAERFRQLATVGLILERLRIAPESVQATPASQPAPLSAHLALVTSSPPPKPDFRNVPVLHEEVPETLLRRTVEDEPVQPVEDAQDLSAEAPLPPSLPGPVHPETPVDTAPVVRMPGNRSRLMRMKNRGLFTNE